MNCDRGAMWVYIIRFIMHDMRRFERAECGLIERLFILIFNFLHL